MTFEIYSKESRYMDLISDPTMMILFGIGLVFLAARTRI
jgi:hypothetical protein